MLATAFHYEFVLVVFIAIGKMFPLQQYTNALKYETYFQNAISYSYMNIWQNV